MMLAANTFALVCLSLSVHAGVNPHLFRVDIKPLQKEGRDESKDITFIQDTLVNSAGIDVLLARKAFDNQNIILVLQVKDICSWSSLTSAFTNMGYRLSVTSLQTCSDYARQLGVDVLYSPLKEVQELDQSHIYDFTFDSGDLTHTEYMSRISNHFVRDIEVMKKNITVVCYTPLGEVPVRLVYFAAVSPVTLEEIEEYVKLHGHTSYNMLLPLLSFQAYKNAC